MDFSVAELGKDRAYAAAKRARVLGEKGGYTIDPGNYDGSVPREKMGELSKDEELAYMKARTLYLESMLELQKKCHPYWRKHLYTRRKGSSRRPFPNGAQCGAERIRKGKWLSKDEDIPYVFRES